MTVRWPVVGADPTPELVAALERIGWKAALARHPSLVTPLLDLRPVASDMFRDHAEATEAADALKALLDTFAVVEAAWQNLPLVLRQQSELTNLERSIAAAFGAPMDDLINRVGAEARLLNVWRRGRPPNAAAIRIARELAEVHFLAKGRMPSVGRSPAGEPNGTFARSVDTIFHLVGIQCADVTAVCLKAIASIDEGQRAVLRDKRLGRAGLSLVDFCEPRDTD